MKKSNEQEEEIFDILDNKNKLINDLSNDICNKIKSISLAENKTEKGIVMFILMSISMIKTKMLFDFEKNAIESSESSNKEEIHNELIFVTNTMEKQMYKILKDQEKK